MSHSWSSLRLTVLPAPPSRRTLSGTTMAAFPWILSSVFDVLEEVELFVAGGCPELAS